MKISSAGSRPPLTRAAARNCLLVNQFATPGLGSLMAKRFVAGSVQLTLAVIGFCCVITSMTMRLIQMYRDMQGGEPSPGSHSWVGTIGWSIFIGSWLLAWTTSLSVLREARLNEQRQPPIARPPIIR